MKQKYLSFFIRLCFMTLLVGLTGWALGTILPENTVSPVFPLILLLFFAVTAGMHLILLRITSQNPRRFVAYFMLATFLKLFLYLAAVLVYLITLRVNILSFIVTFMIIYLFFSFFEVIFILKQTRD